MEYFFTPYKAQPVPLWKAALPQARVREVRPEAVTLVTRKVPLLVPVAPGANQKPPTPPGSRHRWTMSPWTPSAVRDPRVAAAAPLTLRVAEALAEVTGLT